METAPVCQQCQQPLPENVPEGLCPKCLAKVALGTEPATPGTTLNVNPLAGAAPGTRVPPDPAQLAAQFRQLEILELLGMGGMGTVYKARQPRLDRLVALKILPIESAQYPTFAERFNREARALAKLNHPGIVDVYDFGQTGEYYYFIMEYVDGMNLRRLLQTQTLEPRQALDIVVQICTALQYAHDEGVVHRDIKPENILLNKKGQVKIADFGLAKLLSAAPDTALTLSQAAMGTLNYMAPEQRQNAQKVDHRADIYSLGVVFYEMLTGEVPMGRFEAPSKKVQVDVRLDEVVLRALEREPARRYQHASEIKTSVEELRAPGAVSSGAVPVTSLQAGGGFEFAKPGTETAAELEAKGLRHFWGKASAVWLLAWLMAAVIWVDGPPGRVLGAYARLVPLVGVYCLMWWTLLRRLRFIRQLSAEAHRVFHIEEYGFWRRWVAGYLLTGILHLCMLLPLVCLFNATWVAWQQLHAIPGASNPSAFLMEHAGKEHHFLRNLTAFANAVPTAEIRLQSVARSFSGFTLEGWGGLTVGLAVAFVLLQWPPLMIFGLARARYSWAHYWRPWLAYLATFLGSGLVVFWGVFAWSHFTYATEVMNQPERRSREFRCRLDPGPALQAVWDCLKRQGYESGKQALFDFDFVPKGDLFAQLQLLECHKSGPGDWRLSWRGMRRVWPLLELGLLSSLKPAETVITLNADAGGLLSQGAAQEWLAVGDALAGAVKENQGRQ